MASHKNLTLSLLFVLTHQLVSHQTPTDVYDDSFMFTHCR